MGSSCGLVARVNCGATMACDEVQVTCKRHHVLQRHTRFYRETPGSTETYQVLQIDTRFYRYIPGSTDTHQVLQIDTRFYR